MKQERVINDRYVIHEEIGKSANSKVFRAFDQKKKIDVAIKMMDPILSEDEIAIKRFRRELEILQSFNLEGICKAYDFGFADESYYIVMDLIVGTSLKGLVAKRGALTFSEVLEILKPLIKTLKACHNSSVIHRDLKPSNVMIQEGKVFLLDFGIARINTMSDLTKTGTILGTSFYIAPELLASNQADQRSDIYSLGVVVFEMLCGTPPFAGKEILSVLKHDISKELLDLESKARDMPNWFLAILKKMLQVHPENRYQSLEHVLDDINLKDAALAQAEFSSRGNGCPKCQSILLPGLGFCFSCFYITKIDFSPGSWSLVIEKAAPSDDLIYFLKNTLRLSQNQGERFFQNGTVLLKNVNESTISMLTPELVGLGCTVYGTNSLSTKFKLSSWLLLPAFLPILLLLMGFFQGAHQFGIFLSGFIGAIFIYFNYYFATSGLITAKQIKGRTKKRESMQVISRRSMQRFSSNRIRKSYAQICSLICLTISASTQRRTYELLLKISELAFEIHRELEKLELILSKFSISDLKEKIITNRVRMEAAQKNNQPIVQFIKNEENLNNQLEDFLLLENQYTNTRIKMQELISFISKFPKLSAKGKVNPETSYTQVIQKLDFIANSTKVKGRKAS